MLGEHGLSGLVYLAVLASMSGLTGCSGGDESETDTSANSATGKTGGKTDLVTPGISASQSKAIVDHLNEVCSDTFCGGDFYYDVTTISCENGVCTISLRAQPTDADYGYMDNALEGIDKQSRKLPGTSAQGSFEARLVGAESSDGSNWIRTECALQGEYRSVQDIVASGAGGDTYSENLYNHFIDCVGLIEQTLPSPFLRNTEAKAVVEGLDGVCPDSFCGGDMNYRVQAITCDSKGKWCTIGYLAQPQDEATQWSTTLLDGIDETRLSASGDGENGKYAGKITGAVTIDGSVFANVQCRLDGYGQATDVLEDGQGYSTRLYDQFLDCVHAVEPVLSAL